MREFSTESNDIIGKDSIEMANQPPSDLQITIFPLCLVQDKNVTCQASAIDNDGHDIDYAYEWTSGPVSYTDAILPATATIEGESWNCTVYRQTGLILWCMPRR